MRLAINILLVLLILSILGLAAIGYTKYTGRKLDVTFYEEKALGYAKTTVDKIKSSYKQINKTLQPYLMTGYNKISDVLQYTTDLTNDFITTLKTRYFSSYFQEPAKQEL